MSGNTAIRWISFIAVLGFTQHPRRAVQDLPSTQFIAVLDKKQITFRRARDEHSG